MPYSTPTHQVTITGWAAGADGIEDTFEDCVDVEADSDDAAIAVAVTALKARYNLDYLEIGDVGIAYLPEFDPYEDEEQAYEIAAERRNEQALADSGMY